MKSSDLIVGESYAYGDLYAARRGHLVRVVVLEKRPGGKLLVEGPKRGRYEWNAPDPNAPIVQYEVKSCYVNHTWAEELVAKAARDERAADEAAKKVRADNVLAVFKAAAPPDAGVYVSHYGDRPQIAVSLDAAEAIAEKLHRLAGLDK